MPDTDRLVTVLRAIGHELSTERVTFMAASIAYNAFLSLLPLVLLLLAAVTSIGNQSLEATLLGITNAAVTPQAGDILVQELESNSAEVSVLGVAFLIWGALRIFRSLDAAFSDIYETEARNTFLDQVADGVVVLVSVAAVVAVALVVLTRLPSSLDTPGLWFASRAVLVVGLAAALGPMFYLFPDEPDITISEIVPGVLVTAIGLVVFQSLFEIYLTYSSPAAQTSLLASILVLMTWLYFNGLIVLVGAAVNAVLANRSEDISIEPVIGGVAPEAASATSGRASRAALEDLHDRLADASSWELTIDGESIALPPPARVDPDLGSGPLAAIDGTAGLELRWTIAEESTAPAE